MSAMGQVHFPPEQGIMQGFPVVNISDCVEFGDPLTLYFDDSGFFGYTPTDDFTPPLPPPGFYVAGTVKGPYIAKNHAATVILSFFDLKNYVTYLDTLTVAESCSKSFPVPKLYKSGPD
jgi:hypothetical protein